MKPLDILIVEDDGSLMVALWDLLTAQGYYAATANGGEEAITIALEKHPKLILLDLIMPGMGGMAVLRQLRADAWGAHAKVIVITNLPSETKRAEALALSVTGFYLKSELPLKKLQEDVRELLQSVE